MIQNLKLEKKNFESAFHTKIFHTIKKCQSYSLRSLSRIPHFPINIHLCEYNPIFRLPTSFNFYPHFSLISYRNNHFSFTYLSGKRIFRSLLNSSSQSSSSLSRSYSTNSPSSARAVFKEEKKHTHWNHRQREGRERERERLCNLTSSGAQVRSWLTESARIVSLVRVDDYELRSRNLRPRGLPNRRRSRQRLVVVVVVLIVLGSRRDGTEKLRVSRRRRSRSIVVVDVLRRLKYRKLLVDVQRPRPDRKPAHCLIKIGPRSSPGYGYDNL